MDDPKRREKLLIAKAEIEEVFKRHEVLGHYFIAIGGCSETSIYLDAPWCVAKLETREGGTHAALRVRSLVKDYEGRLEERQQHIEDTVTALRALGLVTGQQAVAMIGMTEKLAVYLGAEFGPIELVRKQ